VSDVGFLAEGLLDHFGGRGDGAMDAYSYRALRRVWKAVRFSWWMTTLLHRLDDEGPFAQRLQEAELDLLASSPAARAAMAEQYVGLAL